MAPRHALGEHLDALRSELANSESLSPDERARLEKLVADVSQHAEGAEVEHEPHTLADHLQEMREQLEESHPNLTLAIGAVADALSRLGI